MSKNLHLNPKKQEQDKTEISIRPCYLQDFLGQEKLKENL